MADFSITGEVRLNSDPAEKSTSKWTVAAGNMIADFAKKAASELGKVVQSGVDYNASMESYLTNFKVMLGNEEQGLAPDVAAACTRLVTIPGTGKVESLNVSVAAAVLMWELVARGGGRGAARRG